MENDSDDDDDDDEVAEVIAEMDVEKHTVTDISANATTSTESDTAALSPPLYRAKAATETITPFKATTENSSASKPMDNKRKHYQTSTDIQIEVLRKEETLQELKKRNLKLKNEKLLLEIDNAKLVKRKMRLEIDILEKRAIDSCDGPSGVSSCMDILLRSAQCNEEHNNSSRSQEFWFKIFRFSDLPLGIVLFIVQKF